MSILQSWSFVLFRLFSSISSTCTGYIRCPIVGPASLKKPTALIGNGGHEWWYIYIYRFCASWKWGPQVPTKEDLEKTLLFYSNWFNDLTLNLSWSKAQMLAFWKLLHFEWSPPWHETNIFWHLFVTYLLTFFLVYISSDILVWHIFWHLFVTYLLDILYEILSDISSDFLSGIHIFWYFGLTHFLTPFCDISSRHSLWDSFWNSCLTGEVQRWPLRSGAPRVSSGAAHCDLHLATYSWRDEEEAGGEGQGQGEGGGGNPHT